MKRLHETLKQCKDEGRGALSIYLCVGDPDVDASASAMKAAIEAGADWLEVGIPFSDPAADGPVIQAATHRAVENGTTVADAWRVIDDVRSAHPTTPLIVMTYANLAYQSGWDNFCGQLAKAGADGLILPDVPLEESAPIRAALAKHDLAWVPLVTPTTPADRMQAIAQHATGFLYVVGNVGITGQSDPGPLVEATVKTARAANQNVPLAVGFGIAKADDVRRVIAAGADAAIVGSAVVGLLPDEAALRSAVAQLRSGA